MKCSALRLRWCQALSRRRARAVALWKAMAFSPHFSPPFYCNGPMPHPDWFSFGQSARHSVDYAYALFGRESQSGRTLEPFCLHGRTVLNFLKGRHLDVQDCACPGLRVQDCACPGLRLLVLSRRVGQTLMIGADVTDTSSPIIKVSPTRRVRINISSLLSGQADQFIDRRLKRWYWIAPVCTSS